MQKIIVTEWDGIDLIDYPEFSGAYISSATWQNGIELTEEELEDVNNNIDKYCIEGVEAVEQLHSDY